MALERHNVAAITIPERVWTKLYARQLDPAAAARRAAIYYHRIRPAGLLWRQPKN